MPAAWLALPMLVFSLWYTTRIPVVSGYGLDAAGRASLLLVFLAPFAAAGAAWEAGRLRRAGLWESPMVRARWEIVLHASGPVWAISACILLLGTLFEAATSDAWPADMRIPAVGCLALVAAVMFGFVAGTRMRLAAALPTGIVVPFVWTAVVPAVEPVWLRHLTSTFRDCCQVGQDLSWAAVVASVAVNLGAIAALVVLLASHGTMGRRPWPAVVALGTGLIVAVGTASPLGYAPASSRLPSALRCAGDTRLHVCVWPEQQQLLGQLTLVAARAQAGWADAGVTVPTEFTAAAADVAPAGSLTFIVDRRTPDDAVLLAFATAMLPPDPQCPLGNTGSIASEYILAWLSMSAGMGEDAVAARFGYDASPYPAIPSVVKALRLATVAERADWMRRAASVSQACDEWDPSLLAVGP